MRLWLTRLYVQRHDIALLRADDPAGTPSAAGIKAIEYSSHDLPDVQRLHEEMGHRFSAELCNRRFRNGLRFFSFVENDVLLGSTWVVAGGARYLDELNWLLPIKPTEFWIRDVFTVPAERGRGRFAAFVRVIAAQHVTGCSGAWSDVDWDNVKSMKAHRNAGFRLYARVSALDFNGRLRLRNALPVWPCRVQEISPARRHVWLNGTLLQRHRELLA